MTPADAIAWLDSLEPYGIRPGLDRIRRLLRRLGSPHERFPSALIAGTNGKGSVAAFLAAILRQSGLRPGVYTSPHLVRFEERIVVGDAIVTTREVALLAREVKTAIEAERFASGDHPTYFEATTAMAFLHFARAAVPFAVLEVGMGGLHDATNAAEPSACAITPIAMDHMQWLGGTLPEIARQKAGILRRGVPAIVARQEPGAMRAIETEAGRVGAPLTLAAACTAVPAAGASIRGSLAAPPGSAAPRLADPPIVSLLTPSGKRYDRLALSLRGAHQIGNATVAVMLAEHLAAGPCPGLDAGAIARGLGAARWPGRLELVPGQPDLLLDGAHNPAGCQSLAAYLRDFHSGRRIALVFAAMRDKPAAEMLAILCPLVETVTVTALPVPRGESPEVLAGIAAAHCASVTPAPEVSLALRLARATAGPQGLVVVSGSLYLVGEVKKLDGG